jgi:hypothetical protein
MKKIATLCAAGLLIGSTAFGQAIRDRNVIPVAVNLNEVLRMTITNGGNIEFVFNSIDEYRFGLSADAANLMNPQDPDIIAGGDIAANESGSTGLVAPAGAISFPGEDGGAAATNSVAGLVHNFYASDFHVASSVRWAIDWGSEYAEFIGTDDPANRLNLNNVGLTLVNRGDYAFAPADEIPGGATVAARLNSRTTNNATQVTALQQYPAPQALINDNGQDLSNAGDMNNNNFSILWRCGTSEEPDPGSVGTHTSMNEYSLLNQGNITPDRYVTNVVFELRREDF